MANYLIIGGDGKEYGPVTDADVRQWIAEGRLNGQSLAKAESDTELRPLSAFPEFAAELNRSLVPVNPATISPNPPSNHQEQVGAEEKIKIPATCLMIIGVLGFVLSLWGVLRLIFFRSGMDQELAQILSRYPQLAEGGMDNMIRMIYGPVGIGTNILAMLLSAVVFIGARQMRQLRRIEMAYVAAIIAMLPCATNCCIWILGLPIGIWAVVVLSNKSVKSQFK